MALSVVGHGAVPFVRVRFPFTITVHFEPASTLVRKVSSGTPATVMSSSAVSSEGVVPEPPQAGRKKPERAAVDSATSGRSVRRMSFMVFSTS
ncbi:MAG: hypothetical protein IPF92_18045 [Myxococcales bacterium]|nr:hypothetical protein [Myxococcales bacterium]